jgi:VIT1/CCC1 family predicted Fe2+/Mn2+ transporter
MSRTSEPNPSSKRPLEPIERISEVLFGLIMVLTVTCSLSVAQAGRSEIRTMFLGAFGCNLAWGIIDAVMYLMGCLADNARAMRTLRAVQNTADPQKGQRLIASSLPAAASSTLGPSELERIRQYLIRLPAPLAHPHLSGKDWRGAASVFLLVVLATFPVVVPFLLMQNGLRAQRISNAIGIGMLFLTGYGFGRCTGYRPRVTGLVMVMLGAVLVGVAIILGG